jgi:hypothetical protein
MTVQRAVVYGEIANLVQTRSMFTADVVEAGGDDFALLWETYLLNVYDSLPTLCNSVYSITTYELQNYTAGQWVPFDIEDLAISGGQGNDPLPNAVSAVFIGKGDGLRKIGKKFISALDELVVDGNNIVGDGIAAAAAFLVAYLGDVEGIGGGTLTPGIVDKNGDFKPFVGGFVSSLLGSCRRRKPGVGI